MKAERRARLVSSPRVAGYGTAVAALLTGLLSGCGSDASTKARPLPSPPKPSGEAAKPADTIVSDARASLLGARSVRVVGDLSGRTGSSGSGTPTQQRFDLRLARGPKGTPLATGSVTTVTTPSGGKPTTVQLGIVRVGETLYLRGDKAYYARIGPKAAAVAGVWLSLPIAQDRALADLTDMDTLANGLAGASSVKVLGVQKVGSVPAAVVRAASGATLYVANTGEPQALRLQRPSSTASNGGSSAPATVLAGTLDYSAYNAAVTVKAPAGAVDLAKVSG